MFDYSTLVFLDCKTTIWGKASDQPPGQTIDIIAIDIATVDTANNKIVEEEKIFVKPEKSKVSQYCEEMFKISQSTLDNKGIPFIEAYRKLKIHYMLQDRLWAGWGTYEKYALDKQCRALKLDGLLSRPHHNIQHLYCLMTGQKIEPSIGEALQEIGIKYHNNDAVDIANIYLKMSKGLKSSGKVRISIPANISILN